MFGFMTFNGDEFIVADAYIPVGDTERKLGYLALRLSLLPELKTRGENTRIAQLSKIVLPGLILTRHVFQGLKRPLLCDENIDGSKQKLIYARKPSFDAIAVNQPDGSFDYRQINAPDAKVLCTIVSPNVADSPYPQIFGWIDRWNWVQEDRGLGEGPDNWIDRYDKKLFSIQDSDRIVSD